MINCLATDVAYVDMTLCLVARYFDNVCVCVVQNIKVCFDTEFNLKLQSNTDTLVS